MEENELRVYIEGVVKNSPSAKKDTIVLQLRTMLDMFLVTLEKNEMKAVVKCIATVLRINPSRVSYLLLSSRSDPEFEIKRRSMNYGKKREKRNRSTVS